MKRLHSVFTDDMDRCIITGTDRGVERHHIFGSGGNRSKSEKYGFVIPLEHSWHNEPPVGIHFNKELDLFWKQEAQRYYEEHIGSREEFIKEFGKGYIDEH